jgi:hypothetical protein
MTEAEFVAQVGRKPTETERLNNGIPWLPVIAPEVLGEVGVAAAGESAPVVEASTQASATASPDASVAMTSPGETTGSAIDLPNAAPASISGSVSQAEHTSPISEPSVSSQSEASSTVTGEDPNAGASPAAGSSPAVGDSASDVSTDTGTSNTGASSAELPLHVQVAHHLEAIYRLVKGE